MSEEELAQLQRQVQRERTARKEAERLLEEKSLALYRSNQQLQRERDRNQRYLDTVQTIMVALDTEGRITMINREGCALLGQPESALLGQAWFDCFLPQPAGVSIVLPLFLRLVAGDLQAGEKLSEYSILDTRGQQHLIAWRNAILTDTGGKIGGTLSSGEDITERKQIEDQVRQLAFYDPLTKLPNRRLLNDRLSQAMFASKRRGYYGALMFLDLDNFKPLNDTHGHVVGDLLLIEAANRLNNCVRKVDTVARFGGDEFVVMLSELDADKAGAASRTEIVAERIRAALAMSYELKIQQEGQAETTVEHHCTASIGVALFGKHEASQDDILKWADAAMYQAKDAGRNLIRFYDSKD
jgi:diguanylate cyclase (GGDEF)-like protein/PAS domain S-box-containing protein